MRGRFAAHYRGSRSRVDRAPRVRPLLWHLRRDQQPEAALHPQQSATERRMVFETVEGDISFPLAIIAVAWLIAFFNK